MNLEKTTQLYASVLRQLLPAGGYDTSPNTEALAVDVYAHAKLLAQADLDGKRLLKVLEELPPELLPEYETEYGLPLKCSINTRRTLEERLEILKWVRSTRNVLNRAYLEQLLAIFGVTLIDIQKFRPILCTASCTDSVNTEQLRYKVFLRLQYPMNADMSCIVENYLPGYLRIEWMIDMPWGEWTLNPGYTLLGNNIRYTGYKTNQHDYYDSYADFDLVTALVRSFHDADMQQWQAVKDAAKQFFNVTTGWVFDNENDVIKLIKSAPKWGANDHIASTPQKACQLLASATGYAYESVYRNSSTEYLCIGQPDTQIGVIYKLGTYMETIQYSYIQLAEKIIQNLTSSSSAIVIYADIYIQAITESLSNSNPTKQFIKLTDVLSQFETNKTLRT